VGTSPPLSLDLILVPGEPRPWGEALRVVVGVGRALQELHAAGIVHRDVRPGSILLPGSGAPKLADAGTARVAASPLYASPEQAVGESVDARADIFALGAVAYRLLTGRDAFFAESPERILARVIHDHPRPASALVPGLPSGVDDVLAMALAKSRKDRYADVGAFCDDLDDLLAGRPPRLARESAARVDTARFLQAAGSPSAADGTASARFVRRPFARALVGLLALALVAGLELLRRKVEEPVAAPGGPPAVEPARREETTVPTSLAGLPSRDEARLAIDFKHPIERGTLVVLVDGSPVLERRISAAVTKTLLGIKLREGHLHQVVEVTPGRHEIGVRVRWADEQRTDSITAVFAAGATRRLSAKISRVGNRLSLDWE
jgi:hypothetical protein